MIILAAVILGPIITYTQFWYAKNNFPNTFKARLILFTPAAILGFLIFVRIATEGIMGTVQLLVFAVFGSIFMGILFAFLFPQKVKSIYSRTR